MPRRSTGCLTCIARRVKCDEVKPRCQRCAKAGVECNGYHEGLRFVDEGARVERRVFVERVQGEELVRARKEVGEGKEGCGLYHGGKLGVNELGLGAWKEELCVVYLMGKVFEGREERYVGGGGGTKNWIEDFGSGSKSNTSLRALAKMVYGYGHHSSPIVVEARKSYGLALKELRIQLLDDSRKKSLDTLAAVTALCMYEILDRREDQAWGHHANGLSSLMESRGPLQYQKYPEKSFFLEQRVMLVLKAIISGQKTFLSQPSWKIVPWENDPAAKESLDYLVDILCDVATYLAEIKAHVAGMTPVYVLNLKMRVFASMQELDNWWHVWIKKNPEPCKEMPRGTVPGDGIDPVFPTLLDYKDLWTAYTLMTYSATRILLLQLQHKLSKAENEFQSFNPSSNNVPLPTQNNRTPLQGITSSIEDLACEILRSLEYGHKQSRQFMCTFICLFVLDVAYSSLDPESKEAGWLRDRMGLDIREERGERVRNWIENGLEIKVLRTCQLLQS